MVPFRPVIIKVFQVIHLVFLVVYREFHKPLKKRS